MLKVISFTICPFVQRVTAALEARKIPYEIEFIELSNKPDWFKSISPNGQVPVMITESGTALFESDAICEYIEDEYGALTKEQSNESKALERAWGYLGTKHYLTQCGAMSSKDGETLESRSAKLRQAFEKVEKQLTEDSHFFSGNKIGNVDVAWLPLLHRASIVEEHSGYDFLCGLPKLKAWQTRLLETGIANASVAENFDEKFKRFYLTNTFLAQNQDIISDMQKCSSCC
ncbi:glutathione S-transferase family protein [Vibrio sonorensis]|uniref:glutathione S-transferase family protein n=1 Tax=Vibrio sonorensis TaxID=1004316 RepID=UPI0008DB0D0F|nr:glutathione S-transferase family protein [Vibrio sonorensis]